MARKRLTFIGLPPHVGEPLRRLARFVLWTVIITASLKPAEIFGPGEQSWVEPPFEDLLFRCLVLGGCLLAFAIALLLGSVRRAGAIFTPFLLWSFFVTVIRQSELTSAKQIGSYATWILFYVAATSLLKEDGDYKRLTWVVVAAVGLSAFCGELQHWLGYAPGVGSMWTDSVNMEFMRTHTGAGGILLDAFTPCCASVLILSAAGTSIKRHLFAWLLALWGTANILRGGMLALAVAACWLVFMSNRRSRKYLLSLMGVGLLFGGLLFGGTISGKFVDANNDINTSGRLDEWPQLLSWISDEPIVGHGPDADLEMLARSATGRDLRAAHNEFLSTGVNFGILGILLLWVPLLFLVVAGIIRTSQAKLENREQLCGATAVLIMIAVLSLTDNTLRSPGIMILALAPTAILRPRPNSSAAAPLEMSEPGSQEGLIVSAVIPARSRLGVLRRAYPIALSEGGCQCS